MSDPRPGALVSVDWLAEHLPDPQLRVVDGSWHMPVLKRDPQAEFLAAHIPGAVYFDIDSIADTSSALPHMVPTDEVFGDAVGRLGIGNDDQVVVYDANGNGSAARVWWMFRLFGHERVSVLDGGLSRWQAQGLDTQAGEPAAAMAQFVARRNASLLRTVDDLMANLDSGAEQVLDARSAGRFTASEPEPRAGLRGGRIPGSFNQPFIDLYDPDTRTLRPVEELASLFDASGVDRGAPIVTSCGSGVTACNLALGLYLVGKTDVAVYDGSWTEWGGREDTPVEA